MAPSLIRIAPSDPEPYMPYVVVADDDPAVTAFFRVYLQRLGIEIAVVSSGAELLDLVSSRRPDLVFCDMVMPGMTGIDVLLSLPDADFPIVAMSGAPLNDVDSIGGLENTRWIGASYVLPKPFELPALAEVLKKTLGDSLPPGSTQALNP